MLWFHGVSESLVRYPTDSTGLPCRYISAKELRAEGPGIRDPRPKNAKAAGVSRRAESLVERLWNKYTPFAEMICKVGNKNIRFGMRGMGRGWGGGGVDASEAKSAIQLAHQIRLGPSSVGSH